MFWVKWYRELSMSFFKKVSSSNSVNRLDNEMERYQHDFDELLKELQKANEEIVRLKSENKSLKEMLQSKHKKS